MMPARPFAARQPKTGRPLNSALLASSAMVRQMASRCRQGSAEVRGLPVLSCLAAKGQAGNISSPTVRQ